MTMPQTENSRSIFKILEKSKNFLHFLKSHSTALDQQLDNHETTSSNEVQSSDLEFSRYEREVANKLGYFAITLTGFYRDPFGNYRLKSTAPIAQLIFWGCYLNTFIKAVFLCFLVTDYFGPVVFLDKIAALDYILCVGIAVCGTLVWGLRYPLHEILHSFWTVENSIFQNLGCPQDLKAAVERRHWATVWIHLAIVWIGCSCLAIQFYADPKYCTFTYSAFAWDNWWLRIIFCLHEFFFMMNPWNVNTSSSALCTFEGVSIASLLERMTGALNASCTKSKQSSIRKDRKAYSVDKLIFDYQQLILITDRFNDWVAYKVLAIHVCSYCQFISDVFVAIQVLKGGGGFADVWFYLEDCLAGVFMIYRVYTSMSRVAAESKRFLKILADYLKYYPPSRKKMHTKILKTLKVVSLRLGPIVVTPMTVLAAMDTFGNYYVCVALWKTK